MKKKKLKNKFHNQLRRYERLYSLGLLLLYLIMVIALIVGLIKFPVLPMRYTIILVGVLALFFGWILFLQISPKIKRKVRRSGKVLIFLLTIALLLVNVYVYRTDSFIRGITGGKYKTDTVSLVVLKESNYQQLSDVLEQPLGMDDDKEHYVVKAIADIQEELKTSLDVSTFESLIDLSDALFTNEVEGIFINEAYRKLIEEENPGFSSKTRVIHSVSIKTLIDTSKNVEVTKNSFTIYISGIDTEGDISVTSRSDVNILLTVNPKTNVILMTTTPRDSYVGLGCINGYPNDKLTHAAIYGIDCSIASLENYYGTEINYYVKVNFSSLEKIVDALGGIKVHSDNAFSVGNIVQIKEGINTLNGKQALAFSRDRQHQPNGDEDRGRNQMKVIEAMIDKAISPTIITNYMNILKAVQNNFETSMEFDDIVALANMQLNDMAGWTIIQNSVTGTYGTDSSYAMGGQLLSIFYPNTQSVEYAADLIEQVKDGTLTSQPEDVDFDYEPIPDQSEPEPEPEPEVILSSENRLSSLVLADLDGNPVYLDQAFNPDIYSYHAIAESYVRTLNITGAGYDDTIQSITGIDTYILEYGDNIINISVEAEDGTIQVYDILVTRKPEVVVEPEPTPEPQPEPNPEVQP